MEEQSVKWCEVCEVNTPHIVERDWTGTWVRIVSECLTCGEITEEDKEWTY